MGRRHYSKPRTFASILRELRGNEPWGGRLARNFVFRIWPKAMGEGISRAARPVFLKKDCLHVEVGDSIWLYELETRKRELLARINEHLDDSRIGDIRFRLSNAGLSLGDGDEGGESAPPCRKAEPISTCDDAAIDGAIADVGDEGLRQAAEKLIHHIRVHENSLQ